MPVVIGLAVGALLLWGGTWLLTHRAAPAPAPRGGIASSGGRQQVTRTVTDAEAAKRRIEQQGVFAGGDNELAFGTFGLGVGALLGPAGAAVGLGLGLLIGSLVDAIGQPSYGRIVRDTLSQWNREHGFASDSVATDATLFRDGLLGSRHVWRHKQTGQLAIEVIGHYADGSLDLSLLGGPRQGPGAPFIPGFSNTQVKQQIAGWAPGMMDGPNQRNANSAFRDRARNGELYAIDYVDAVSSWRTPGYVWFQVLWPRLNREHPIARTADWQKFTPDADNVDMLAQPFDRAGGIEWQVAQVAP